MSVLDKVDALPERIRRRLTIDDPAGCWLWQGSHNDRGYGQVSWTGRRTAYVHRVVFHLLVDDTVPVFAGDSGTIIDHLCRVRECANPEHLRCTTSRENTVTGLPGVLGSHSSPFVGVHWDSGRRMWRTAIRVEGSSRFLGHFGDAAAAAAAYDRAVRQHFGPDATTNESLGLLTAEVAS